MEVALTPIEFLRRARKLYADREAVVDGPRRLTYAQFGDRIDRWSAALQAMGVGEGDRVAYISSNTCSHLEGYYAVPQIGGVIVPVKFPNDPFAFDTTMCRIVNVIEDLWVSMRQVCAPADAAMNRTKTARMRFIARPPRSAA